MILKHGSVQGFIHDHPRSNLQVKIAIRVGSGPVTKRREFYASSLLLVRSSYQLKHNVRENVPTEINELLLPLREKISKKTSRDGSRKFKILSSSLRFDGVDHQFIMLYEGRLKQS